jgi:hypothetical protein
MDTDSLIDAHPQAAQIRLIQRTGYCAYSWRHRNGLDALSFVLGPAAVLGFALVSNHRENQAVECRCAVLNLLSTLGNSVSDRRIVSVLLTDYPARDPMIAQLLREHLKQTA